MNILTTIFLLFATLALVESQSPRLSSTAMPDILLAKTFIPPTHTIPTHAGHATGPSATCTQTIIPDKNGYVPPGTCDALYDYYPSFGAAIAAASVFGLLTVTHIGQALWYRKSFCWVIIMGCLWELAAYGTRAAGTRNQQNVGELLFFQIFVLLAPLWVNAFDYVVLGRMIHFFLPTHSILGIRASLLSVMFVLLDIGSFIVQLYGTTMTSSTSPPATILRGTHIYMGGIGLQEFFIIIFFGIGVVFQFSMLRLEVNNELPKEKQNWRRLLYSLYASLFFITIRIIFRLVEFSAGPGTNNPLPYHEAYFYVFDAIPMSFAILVMSITHPGTVLYGPDSVFPKSQWRMKRQAKKALRKEEKEMKTQTILENKRMKKMRKETKNQRGYIEMFPDQERHAGMEH